MKTFVAPLYRHHFSLLYILVSVFQDFNTHLGIIFLYIIEFNFIYCSVTCFFLTADFFYANISKLAFSFTLFLTCF